MPTTLRKLLPAARSPDRARRDPQCLRRQRGRALRSATTTETEATSDRRRPRPGRGRGERPGVPRGRRVRGRPLPSGRLRRRAGGDAQLHDLRRRRASRAASPPRRPRGSQYTGEIEGPDGPSSLGGSSSEGSITDPASVEESLNETLSDEAGEPTADCPDAPEGDSLECEVSGDGVTGTLTATPIGGFEWEGQIETPDGTRAISGQRASLSSPLSQSSHGFKAPGERRRGPHRWGRTRCRADDDEDGNGQSRGHDGADRPRRRGRRRPRARRRATREGRRRAQDDRARSRRSPSSPTSTSTTPSRSRRSTPAPTASA